VARLHEHEGKRLLREMGVRLPQGALAATPQEAKRIAAEIEGPVAVKAQIWATGRFMAGGIQFASSPNEVEQVASRLLGSRIKGFDVQSVLVEQKLEVVQEFYAGIIVDDSYKVRAPVVLFSTEGGVDIEEVARTAPERIARLTVDIRRGVRAYDAYNLALRLGLSGPVLTQVGQAIRGLYVAFRGYDARSAEINPLVLSADGKVYAADCRISVDDSSVMRHPELGIVFPRESDRPPTELEQLGWQIEADDYRGVSFFAEVPTEDRGNGYIGYHAISGGAAFLAADSLTRHGFTLANFAETSGNPTASKVYRCAKVILSQPGIEGYCLIGAVIANQDQRHHARGLVKAFKEDLTGRPGFPVVVLLAGNKEEGALRILEDGLRDLPVHLQLYGREYIHRLDFVADRMKALVRGYRALPKGGA
jgi:succinyl-CoA synthetase beta subunit